MVNFFSWIYRSIERLKDPQEKKAVKYCTVMYEIYPNSFVLVTVRASLNGQNGHHHSEMTASSISSTYR